MSDIEDDRVVIALEGWARGAYDCEAAVMMLTRGTMWRRLKGDLLSVKAIGTDEEGGRGWMDRDALEEYALDNGLSGGERRVLWLIASLLGVVTAPPIGELLSGIDDRNVAVFLQAAAHLAGWHERGESTVVTGRIGA
mgnify:FL=1